VRTALPRGDFTWRLYDLSVDPGETTDLSSENPELFAELRAEYEAYAADNGVFDLGREDYAEAQLFSNLLERTVANTGRTWPASSWRCSSAFTLSSASFGWRSAARPTEPEKTRAPVEGRMTNPDFGDLS
jgi:hypothetical protein